MSGGDDELDLGRIIRVARATAREAGELLAEGRRAGLDVEHKGRVDLVTEYDLRSEELIVAALLSAFPEHRVVGEEGGVHAAGQQSRPCWYIDPLDGTTNYAHGVPWYAISLGLELQGELQAGVVYAPELGWEFWAVRGGGAFRGEQRLQVSKTVELSDALLATGFPYDRSDLHNTDRVRSALQRGQGVRRMGTASLDCAMVACGWFDGYWEFSVNAWDVSAGALLVREAGGRVTRVDGAPFVVTGGQIAASNGRIHQQMLDVVALG